MLDLVKTSKENFSYQRKFSIKSLFSPREILGKFSILEFEDAAVFLQFLSKGYQAPTKDKEYLIHIDSIEGLTALISVLESTDLTQQVMIVLDIPDIELLKVAMPLLGGSNLDRTCIRVTAESAKAFEGLQEDAGNIFRNYLQKNGIWLDFLFEASSYAERYETVIKAHIQFPFIQLLDLHIDYLSFEDCKLSELHKVKFYINRISIWVRKSYVFAPLLPAKPKEDNSEIKINDEASCNNCETKYYKLILKHRLSSLKAFISRDMDIFLSADAFIKKDMYFELSRYLEKCGEELSYLELGRIRQLVDVRFKEPLFKNLYMIDMYANLKIMKDLYMIPSLTTLISYWLEHGEKE